MTLLQKPFFLTYCEKCNRSSAVGDTRVLTIDGEPWMHHNPLAFCGKCHTKLKKVWNTDPEFPKADKAYKDMYGKDSTGRPKAPSYQDTIREKPMPEKQGRPMGPKNGGNPDGRQEAGCLSA